MFKSEDMHCIAVSAWQSVGTVHFHSLIDRAVAVKSTLSPWEIKSFQF